MFIRPYIILAHLILTLKLKFGQQSIRIMNQLSHGQAIKMPKPIVRTVSLQKLRNPSPLSQIKANNQNVFANKVEVKGKCNNMYQKILQKKLGVKKSLNDVSIRQAKINQQRTMPTNKLEQIKKEMEEKEMKECTFKPIINPSDKDKRSVNTFFNDQINFCKKKNDKIQEMRMLIDANKDKQNTFRPNPHKIYNHEQAKKASQRLYQQSKNKEKLNQLSRQQSNEKLRQNSMTKSKRFRGISRGTSSEKITKNNSHNKNDQPAYSISQQLLKDETGQLTDRLSSNVSAVTTRKTSIELPSKSKLKYERKGIQLSKRVDLNINEKKQTNSKSQQLYITKLIKEMMLIIDRCDLSLVFNYIELGLFFQKMNFIPKESNNTARKLLFEVWSTLQGEIFEEVSALSAMKIVLAIMGCHKTSLVNELITKFLLVSKQLIDSFEKKVRQKGRTLSFGQNILMISDRDSKTIKTSFQQLYLNRMNIGQSQYLKDEKQLQYTFHPNISKTSNQLAEKYRNRVIAQSQKLIAENKLSFNVPQDGQIDHVKLLLLDDKRKDALIQIKRQQKQRQIKKLQDQSMINNHISQRSSNSSQRNNPKDRNRQLYQLGKNMYQNKKDRSTDQIRQQKWKEQLTFKPNLHAKHNILNQLASKEQFIPDYEKTIYRMHEARRLRGQKQQTKNTSPLLYLNVVMEGYQSVKIPVFSNDNMHSITQNVRKIMKLQKQGDSQRLEKILKAQIMPGLKQMGLANFMHE